MDSIAHKKTAAGELAWPRVERKPVGLYSLIAPAAAARQTGILSAIVPDAAW